MEIDIAWCQERVTLAMDRMVFLFFFHMGRGSGLEMIEIGFTYLIIDKEYSSTVIAGAYEKKNGPTNIRCRGKKAWIHTGDKGRDIL